MCLKCNLLIRQLPALRGGFCGVDVSWLWLNCKSRHITKPLMPGWGNFCNSWSFFSFPWFLLYQDVYSGDILTAACSHRLHVLSNRLWSFFHACCFVVRAEQFTNGVCWVIYPFTHRRTLLTDKTAADLYAQVCTALKLQLLWGNQKECDRMQ